MFNTNMGTEYAMTALAIVLYLLPALATCTGYGNIHLLEEDVATALHICTVTNGIDIKDVVRRRQRRSDEILNENRAPRIDANTNREKNPYNHKRRNTRLTDQMYIINSSNLDNFNGRSGESDQKFINTVPLPATRDTNSDVNYVNSTRTKRNEPLINNDNDQCLSQCVFANLEVVDSRGIPREAELWNKIQTSVTSQQSRTLLKDQIRACFQELQSESEDNGCSYSNKLEKCLMLRFSDRKIAPT